MNKKILIFIIFFLLFSFFKSHIAIASEYASEVFSKIRTESLDAPESFGSYSKGCLSGGRYLPSHKFHYDALKPSRNRFWGHPNLLNFIFLVKCVPRDFVLIGMVLNFIKKKYLQF